MEKEYAPLAFLVVKFLILKILLVILMLGTLQSARLHSNGSKKKKKKPRNMIIIVEKVICNSLLKIKTKKLFVIVNSQHCFYIFAVVHQ